MNYCPQCGGRVVLKWVSSDQRSRHFCTNCSAIHYENPRILVWCYVHWGERLVFCRRAHPPAKGRWAPPAGFVEKCETLEEAVVREVGEETGIRLADAEVKLFRVASLPHMNEVYVEYRAELSKEPSFEPGPETLELALFSETEVPRTELAFRDMLPAYPDEFFRCLRERQWPITSVALRPRAGG